MSDKIMALQTGNTTQHKEIVHRAVGFNLKLPELARISRGPVLQAIITEKTYRCWQEQKMCVTIGLLVGIVSCSVIISLYSLLCTFLTGGTHNTKKVLARTQKTQLILIYSFHNSNTKFTVHKHLMV